MTYEERAYRETLEWRKKFRKKGSLVGRLSRSAQTKMNQLIPEGFHKAMTEAVKGMVQSVLTGSNLVFKHTIPKFDTLEERENFIKEQQEKYRKTAMIEGAGTGAGGFLLGLADFPLLLSIKMKFLFDIARVHGYNLRKKEERIFLLLVFQLTFSSNEKKVETLRMIERWSQVKHELQDFDWRTFQQEYRDTIDLAKMLQLMPGFGAVVGAYANYQLLDQLGETALHAYRIRYFAEKEEASAQLQ